MATTFALPDPTRLPASFASLLLDAASEKVAHIFQAPKTGNIDRVLIRTGPVTTAETLRVALQTVDASGDASGTNYGGSAPGSQTSPAANTQYEVTLATPATAVMGNDIALVVDFLAAVGNLNISVISAVATNVYGVPYSELYTGTWAKSQVLPCAGVRYDDGSYYDAFTAPCALIPANSFNVNTAGADEFALRFSLDVPLRLVGFWAHMGHNAGADYEAILYSGTTALLTVAVDGDAKSAAGPNLVCRRFGSTYDLAASTEYRLGIRPTTTNNLSIRTHTQNSAGYWGAMPLGTSGYISKRLDQGAWTDTTTERPLIGLLVEPIAGSSGAGIARLIGKGLAN